MRPHIGIGKGHVACVTGNQPTRQAFATQHRQIFKETL
jgi:hypothetical protein